MTIEEVTHKIQEAGLEIMYIHHGKNVEHYVDPNFGFMITDDIWLLVFNMRDGLEFRVRATFKTKNGRTSALDLVWPKHIGPFDKQSNMLWPCDVSDRRVNFNEDELHMMLKCVKRMIR